MHPRKRTNAVLVALIASLALAQGCRDFARGGGRLATTHVLAGRTTPTLTSSEVARGTFESQDAHVAPLQAVLRGLGGTFALTTPLFPEAAGTAEVYDPRNPAMRTSGPAVVTSAFGTPLVPPMPLADLNTELQALCAHPLLAGRIPSSACNGFKLDSFNGVPIDDIRLTVDPAATTVYWDAPRTVVNTYTYPSTEGSCTENADGTIKSSCEPGFSCPVDADGANMAGTCVWNHLCLVDEDCRDKAFVEPGVCAVSVGTCTVYNDFDEWGSEQDREAPVLVVRLSLTGDINEEEWLDPLANFHLDSLVFELRFQPVPCTGSRCRFNGATIFPGYRTAAPSSVVESAAGLDVYARSALVEKSLRIEPIGTCILFPFLCGAVEAARDPLNAALDKLGPKPGKVIDGLLNMPGLSFTLPGLGTLEPNNVFVGPTAAPLGSAGGGWATSTIDFLHDGGPLQRAVLDLSRMNATCQACPASGGPEECLACRELCSDPTDLSSCDLSNKGVCLDTAATGYGALCAPDDYRLDFGAFNTAYAFLDPLPPGATPEQVAERTRRLREVWAMISTPLPPSPNAATLMDGVIGLGVTAQRIFTTPLDAYDPSGALHFTDAVWCGASDARPAACLPSESAAVFRFTPDGDGDRVPDADDNCPGVDNPAQEDVDGDGFGDACDLCPWTYDLINNGHACTCDIDRDGCLNPLAAMPVEGAPASVPRECVPADGETFDEAPLSSSLHDDNDGDGIPDDCDPDDDNDGVPDEEDNCQFVANPEQYDTNGNGIGDACDICTADVPVCTDAEDIGLELDFGVEILPFIELFEGGRLPFDCIADGPGCLELLVQLCPQGDALCSGGSLDVVGVDGQALRLTAKDLGGDGVRDAALLPDLTGDGVFEIALALSLGEGGVLLVVDPVDAKALWGFEEKGGFGASVVVDREAGLLAVSAPAYGWSDNPSGAVFVFDPWGQPLSALIGEEGDHLGSELLAPGGGLLLVGAPGRQAVLLAQLETGQVLDGLVGEEGLGTGPMALLEPGVVVLGAPDADNGAGRLYAAALEGQVFAGIFATAYGAEVFPNQGPARLGASVTASMPVGGRATVVVGAPGAKDGAGALALFDLEQGARYAGWSGLGPVGLGSQLASVGDRNGDGALDLGVGLPTRDVHLVLYGRK